MLKQVLHFVINMLSIVDKLSVAITDIKRVILKTTLWLAFKTAREHTI
jgi:hypothetical protein